MNASWPVKAVLLGLTLAFAYGACRSYSLAQPAFVLDFNNLNVISTGYLNPGLSLPFGIGYRRGFSHCSTGIEDVGKDHFLLGEWIANGSVLPKSVLRDFMGNKIATFPLAGQVGPPHEEHGFVGPARIPWTSDLRLSPDTQLLGVVGAKSWTSGRCFTGLFVGRRGRDDWQTVWCGDRESIVPNSLSWVGDSKTILFTRASNVFVTQLGNMADPRRILSGNVVRFSVPKQRLAVVDGEFLRVYDTDVRLEQLSLVKEIRIAGLLATGLEWSPNGASLAFTYRTRWQPGDSRTSSEIGLLDTTNWKTRDLKGTWGDRKEFR